jgi:hypothetical protein
MRLLHASWNITGHNTTYLQNLLLLLFIYLLTYLVTAIEFPRGGSSLSTDKTNET